ncbi:hypothetical protein BG005_011610 [Podila minutissima]|nr:hypothetical protein BG005_011610 [Podila minutissima]
MQVCIERICTKFNDEELKKVKARFAAKSVKLKKFEGVEFEKSVKEKLDKLTLVKATDRWGETSPSGGGDDELHRHFTVDLIDKRRPTIQCLIRNTIRDILYLVVTNPPVSLGTRSLDRIQSIEDPDTANHQLSEQYRTEKSGSSATRATRGGGWRDTCDVAAWEAGVWKPAVMGGMVSTDADGDDGPLDHANDVDFNDDHEPGKLQMHASEE